MAAPTAPPAPRRLACARCGTAFDCALSLECWCASVPKRLPLPGEDPAQDCLCPACLHAATGLSAPQNTPR